LLPPHFENDTSGSSLLLLEQRVEVIEHEGSFPICLLSAFSVPRSKHHRPSDARSLSKIPLTFEHRIAEIHAFSMKPLSKIESTDDASDGAEDE